MIPITSPKYVSFGLGVVSGFLVLGIVLFGYHAVTGNRGGFPQRGNFANGAGLSRMAERLGIPEADLQKELDSGKTMQQIAQEHGVTFQGRNGGGGGFPGGPGTGSGTQQSSPASSASGVTMSSSSVPSSSQP